MQHRILGRGKWIVLSRIIIPLSIPGVVSGITMVMVPSISEFVIASMLGGGKVYLIGNVIEQAFNSGYADIHAGSGLSLSLMVLIVISMVIYRFFDGEGGRTEYGKTESSIEKDLSCCCIDDALSSDTHIDCIVC